MRDVSFEPDLFEFLIGQMARNPRLGVAGAPFREGSFQYNYRYTNIENVWGGCQLFRRECFEGIGGYMPLKGGCIDHVAVVSARMQGWQTRTFTSKVVLHHRQMGTAFSAGSRPSSTWAQRTTASATIRSGSRKDDLPNEEPSLCGWRCSAWIRVRVVANAARRGSSVTRISGLCPA